MGVLLGVVVVIAIVLAVRSVSASRYGHHGRRRH
jgi:hypothetical protein